MTTSIFRQPYNQDRFFIASCFKLISILIHLNLSQSKRITIYVSLTVANKNNSTLKWWKWNGTKCYCVKKQKEHFCIYREIQELHITYFCGSLGSFFFFFFGILGLFTTAGFSLVGAAGTISSAWRFTSCNTQHIYNSWIVKKKLTLKSIPETNQYSAIRVCFLVKETIGAFDEFWTHIWQVSIYHE